VTTTLYVITVGVWYTLLTYNQPEQQALCSADKTNIEKRFEVKTICITNTTDLLIIGSNFYPK